MECIHRARRRQKSVQCTFIACDCFCDRQYNGFSIISVFKCFNNSFPDKNRLLLVAGAPLAGYERAIIFKSQEMLSIEFYSLFRSRRTFVMIPLSCVRFTRFDYTFMIIETVLKTFRCKTHNWTPQMQTNSANRTWLRGAIKNVLLTPERTIQLISIILG